jgi:hypothetical protein
MIEILNRRQEIYEYFHNKEHCQNFFFDSAQKERFAAYYTSMYLLQDTAESLFSHREKGFSSNPFEAYIEFWGVMQALIIQQDAISELFEAITGAKLSTGKLSSWQALRVLRHTCAGHPAKKDHPKNSPIKRTFMGRNFGTYSMITYEEWQAGRGISHPTIRYGDLVDEYTKEAESCLLEALSSMKQQW